jgi:hypothetical protein
LTVALAAGRFEDRDAAAVGLACSLAERLDEHPADAKYLAARLLATLVELRLTPAARAGVLKAAAEEPDEKKFVGSQLELLRLIVQARKSGIPGLGGYLSHRDWRDFDEDTQRSYFGYVMDDREKAQVDAVTAALNDLGGVKSDLA